VEEEEEEEEEEREKFNPRSYNAHPTQDKHNSWYVCGYL
jgi:hypothetical protein